MEIKKPIAAKNRTYTRAKNAQASPAADEGAPFGQAMQSLYSLVGLLRNMSPEGDGGSLNPKLVLSASGLEIRFNGAGTESADAAKMEKSDGPAQAALTQRVAELEEQLRTQAQLIDTLRAAVQQNEELMETLVDSMDMMDDPGQSILGPELVPETIAS